MAKPSEMITTIIKARNEARQIEETVASAFVLSDTVIVVDDCSTDSTAAIAEESGARVIRGEPHGGRIDLLDRQGFLEVSEGWILRMDADERLTPALVNALRTISREDSCVAVSYARLNYMFGQGVRHGGWFAAHQRGFFRASAWDRSWDGRIHSQVPVHGSIRTVDPAEAWMVHLDYEDIDTFVERTLRNYAAAEAKELSESGVKFSKRRILVDPFVRTWGRYFIRAGFRDGQRGLVLAGLLGAYDIMRWSLLWEIQKDKEGPEHG